MTIDIEFSKIRPHRGDRKFGFEELCAQIAKTEYSNFDGSFVRKGQGADGGVEFFFTAPSGEETAWQAKYVFDWDSLRSQTKISLEKATEKHPRLAKYIICIPFNLSDGRQKKRKSARQKYTAWISVQKKRLESIGRLIEIELWDETALIGFLTSDTEHMSGILTYWFDALNFTNDWFMSSFASTKASLGSRYTPKSNVNLPIRNSLSAASQNQNFYKELDKLSDRFDETSGDCLRALQRSVATSAERETIEREFCTNFNGLSSYLHLVQEYGFEHVAPSCWNALLSKCRSALDNVTSLIYAVETEAGNESAQRDKRFAMRSIYDLRSFMDEFAAEFVEKKFKLAHANAIILDGVAGTGKSHLMADILEEHIQNKLPGIMVLGSQFNTTSNPWRCLIDELNLPRHVNANCFLSALNSAAIAKNCRALIFVDAINEREGLEIWPDRLQSFINEVNPYSHICLVLSCRTTFLQYIIPDDFDYNSMERLTHSGFAQTGGAAANTYLDSRGIYRVATPNLSIEFENPLFLKTLCDYLDKTGQRHLPKGLDSISALFKYYNEAVASQVDKALKLDSKLKISARAISGFAKLLVSGKSEYISYKEANEFFDSIRDSKGKYSQSLLALLISEGVLSEEYVRIENGAVAPVVRFTFQRFNDYAIANLLIRESVNVAKKTTGVGIRSFFIRLLPSAYSIFKKQRVPKELRPGGRIYDFIFADDSYRKAGVIEALCVLIPEHYNQELIELCPQDDIPFSVRNGFRESLVLRDQTKFSDATMWCIRNYYSDEKVDDILVQISTEPLNKFNALYRHETLKDLSMVERDLSWSYYVLWSDQENTAPVVDLISWCIENGSYQLEHGRSKLAAIQLTWFLTTNNRWIRDRATKALSCILSVRSSLSLEIYQLFAGIDAPYLQERLLCAIYGACIQGADQSNLSEIATAVYERLFLAGSPPGNALLRDHARGILLYADFRGLLPCGIDIERSDPNIGNLPDIEHVPDSLIETYTKDYGSGNVFGDSIVSSVINDGDFARYVVDGKVALWSATRKNGGQQKSPEVLFHAWENNFLATANADQCKAYESLKSSCEELGGNIPFPLTPKGKVLKTLHDNFQLTLNEESWDEYRSLAENYLVGQLFSSHDFGSDIKSFDSLWGRRWICKRAHDFGWTVEQFDNLEIGLSQDRNNHKRERFGKKFQWLALYDLISRLGEQYEFITQKYTMDEPTTLTGAGQIGLRNIDPSLLVTRTKYDGWRDGANVWWAPADLNLKKASPIDRINWLNSDTDILNNETLFNVTNPAENSDWLVLNSFYSFGKSGVYEGHKRKERETWCRIRCYVVKKADVKKFIAETSKKIITSSHSLPTKTLSWGHNYLGEYPWHPEAPDAEMWVKDRFSSDYTGDVAIPNTEYFCEIGGHDYSMDESVRLNLPDQWVYDGLGLRLQSGKDLQYVDGSDEITFFDPSGKTEGPSAALVDKRKFLELLKKLKCEAIWVIAGEKNVYGGQQAGRGFGGRLEHTATYILKDGRYERAYFEHMSYPTKQQLEECFEGEPVPADLPIRAVVPNLSAEKLDQLSNVLQKFTRSTKKEE